MPPDQNEELLELLSRHAKNLIRISSIPSRREVQEFRSKIKAKLRDGVIDLVLRLKELQKDAMDLAESTGVKDVPLYEYYMAVYTEISFLLSALNTDSWSDPSFRADIG